MVIEGMQVDMDVNDDGHTGMIIAVGPRIVTGVRAARHGLPAIGASGRRTLMEWR